MRHPDAPTGRSRGSGSRTQGPALLSVVIPCLDEEEGIGITHRATVAALEKIPDCDLEIIYVDDGSRDSTLERLRDIQSADERVRVIGFTRNFGQTNAITAGLTYSAGDAAVIMDADMQDPPAVAAEMFERWRSGTDIVYGVRSRRKGERHFKRWTAYLFYRLFSRLTSFTVPVDAGEFKLMDRRVVDSLLAMPERTRYLRGMVAWTGFTREIVRFDRPLRQMGVTKWPFRKQVGLALDGLISFSMAPLRLAVLLGMLTSLAALAGLVYGFWVRLFTDGWVSGWAILFSAVLVMGGVQTMIIGIVGEYVGRVFLEVKQRPLFLTSEMLGFASSGAETAGSRDRPDR